MTEIQRFFISAGLGTDLIVFGSVCSAPDNGQFLSSMCCNIIMAD